jgi:hypothetical protein
VHTMTRADLDDWIAPRRVSGGRVAKLGDRRLERGITDRRTHIQHLMCHEVAAEHRHRYLALCGAGPGRESHHAALARLLPDVRTRCPMGDKNRRVLHATCALHRGPVGFTNLVVSKRDDGTIVLEPHAAGACTIILQEPEAPQLFDALGEWLG